MIWWEMGWFICRTQILHFWFTCKDFIYICAVKGRTAQIEISLRIQMLVFLTLPGRGGGLFSPPLTFLFVASKRMYMLVWNFLTFLIYQKPKFWRKKKSDFFSPPPPRRGVLKKWKFWKVVGEPKLQNMIFKAHKNKAKSKRWALYLENWASYDTFRVATWGENLYQTRFSNLKISVSFWDLGPIFCKWAQFLVRSNFYIATWGLTQLLHWFLRGGAD